MTSYLVTGASGQLGRRVVELLLQANVETIIATTRNPEKLADFAEQGVVVRQADFDNSASLDKAFVGADHLLLISTDAVDGTDKRLKQHQTAIQSAEKAGVQHVIYTSLFNPIDSPITFAPDHVGTEQALADSTMGWTILRNSIYADMLVPTLKRAFESGQLFKAAGDGKVAYITREDCAQAAAAALISTFEGTRILDITGSEALSQAEIAEIASSLADKPLTYIPVELDAVINSMVSAGLPQPIAEIFASFDTAIAQGTFEGVSTDFEDLTGQKPTSVKELLLTHQEALLTEAK